ncbi:hypothetical protein QTQ03_23040 [Micromonospora sp. WMMA1363]|nr:hypothetical protein [Micromonospora sp. WMMA1363]MDM4722319.1 hypothetical protein [Micromonospora sp. WMMA1363]
MSTRALATAAGHLLADQHVSGLARASGKALKCARATGVTLDLNHG